MISATKAAVPIRPKEGLQRPALRLVKTTSLDRDQWLEVRKGGIGSSDAAAAVGIASLQVPAAAVDGEDRARWRSARGRSQR
jgi:hypothetical protein